LKNFLCSVNILFAKVYSHKEYTEENLDVLKKIPKLKIKAVEKDGPNAADENLIQSCECVIRDKPEITHVVLISGDDDFRNLIMNLKVQKKQIGVISYKNCSKKLQKNVHFHFTIEEIIKKPEKWWKSIESINTISLQSSRSIKNIQISRPKIMAPKSITTIQQVSSFQSKSKTKQMDLYVVPPKKQFSLTLGQWNKIMDVIGEIFHNQFQKRMIVQLNSVEITYEIRQYVKTGDLYLNNNEINLVIKKLGLIGFLIENFTDSWSLAINHDIDRDYYTNEINEGAPKN
jgi:hypothetical protein